jgi:putative ABC transport system permease protein
VGSGLLQDFRVSIRALLAARLVSLVAMLTLGVAIGANTAVFSVVNSLLLRSLPVSDPDRLMWVSSDFATGHGFKSGAGWNAAMWDALRQRSGFVEGALAWRAERFVIGDAAASEPANGIYASGEFFTTLGVGARPGRVFTARDDGAGGGTGIVAVISHRLWQRRFGGAADVVGTSLLVNNVPVTIIGVTPPAFLGLEVGKPFDLALPLAAEPILAGPSAALFKSRTYLLLVMLRLKSGQPIDAAANTLRGLQSQIVPADAPAFTAEPFTLVPAAGGASSPASAQAVYARPLVIMLAGVGLVLVIACANIANLLLARATARRREFGVRVALGASRWRLARPLLIESFLLAVTGGAVGLLLALWGARAIVALSPLALDLALDWRVAGFVAAMTMATLLLCGLAPASRASRIEPMESMRASRGSADRGRGRLLDGLVVLQISIALVMAVGAGLLVQTFTRLARVPLGFDPDKVLVVHVDAARSPGAAAERVDLHRRLDIAAGGAPGVARSATSIWTPLAGGGLDVGMRPVGAPPDSKPVSVLKNAVSPGWLAVYGTPLKEGRDFTEQDQAGAPRVAIVNEAFVRRFQPEGGAIGRTTPDKLLIVGIAGDAVYRSSRRVPGASSNALREAVPPTMYVPLAQFPIEERPSSDTIRISVRAASGAPAVLAPGVAAAITAVNPLLTVEFRTLAGYVNESLAQERLAAWLAVLFGGVAVLLATLGLYGVTAYAVSRRQSEMGVRMALGATPGEVIRVVLRRALTLVAAGIALGLASATALTRWLASLLFGVTPLDPATFIGLSSALAAIGTLAALVPARKAARVELSAALRAE